MGLDLSGNGSSETMYDEGDRNLAVDGGFVAVLATLNSKVDF